MQKIFISYNHCDKEMAVKVAAHLVQSGFEVIRDEEAMMAGENIRAFILRALNESAVTVSLVSSNSLLSAWVAMETIYSQTENTLDKRLLIPLNIDGSLFEEGSLVSLGSHLETKRQKLEKERQERIAAGYGLEDLRQEEARLEQLKANLANIFAEFKERLCLDISGENFELGMQKVAATLNAHRQLPETLPSPLDELDRQRMADLTKHLRRNQELLQRTEEELDLAEDPRRMMRYERDLERINQRIDKIKKEIAELGK